jgi:hypothetical protein
MTRRNWTPDTDAWAGTRLHPVDVVGKGTLVGFDADAEGWGTSDGLAVGLGDGEETDGVAEHATATIRTMTSASVPAPRAAACRTVVIVCISTSHLLLPREIAE